MARDLAEAPGDNLNPPRFSLGRFADGRGSFVGMIRGDRVMSLRDLVARTRQDSKLRLSGDETMTALLADWDASFAALSAMADQVGADLGQPLAATSALCPIDRPGKIFNAAANYRDHALGMRKTFSGGTVDMSKDTSLDRAKGRPYLFLRASSTIAGPYDPIALPPGTQKIDWEAELAAIIGRRGRNIPAAKALGHVAGFMITNDVSCRDLTWREDRPALRTDWLGGKSFDGFAPTGPYFVPRAFVPDYGKLRIRLWVNGAPKQDGVAGDMIFSIEDQIEYASRFMALEPGDMFATGTPAGTGQERGEFLKTGDTVEIEIDGLGRQRNAVVAGTSEYESG